MFIKLHTCFYDNMTTSLLETKPLCNFIVNSWCLIKTENQNTLSMFLLSFFSTNCLREQIILEKHNSAGRKLGDLTLKGQALKFLWCEFFFPKIFNLLCLFFEMAKTSWCYTKRNKSLASQSSNLTAKSGSILRAEKQRSWRWKPFPRLNQHSR